VSVAVADPCGESAGAVYQYAVVYDPNGGFVTGGGWIHSPEGAYPANPALAGKAHFGFVSGYSRGNSTAPSGRTDFHFSVANFDFSSMTYEWLVISGAKARFRGTGQVNGSGSYGFALTAWDGQAPGGGDGADKFRIRIWDENQGDAVVYDNQIGCPNQGNNADPCTALGGGAIVIHKK
ncbi:MAG: FG-GAP repeat domain-containing protein, partial [Thermoplasmata archaeon]